MPQIALYRARKSKHHPKAGPRSVLKPLSQLPEYHHHWSGVLSGVNRGQNLAEDVTFSGTVAGALQGMQMGVPSIALSLARGFQGANSLPWETAEAHGPELIKDLISKGWPENVILSVNFPDTSPELSLIHI